LAADHRAALGLGGDHKSTAEAIVVDECGLSAFDLLRSWRHDHAAMLCAFDLIEVDGKDLRSGPIEEREHVLAEILPERKAIVFNVHYDCDGATIFKHACALGCEGIVSKRLGSPYCSGRSPHWVKVKNPKAPAVTRVPPTPLTVAKRAYFFVTGRRTPGTARPAPAPPAVTSPHADGYLRRASCRKLILCPVWTSRSARHRRFAERATQEAVERERNREMLQEMFGTQMKRDDQ
jgi:bifunctional non-homologous end joining protein LigD